MNLIQYLYCINNWLIIIAAGYQVVVAVVQGTIVVIIAVIDNKSKYISYLRCAE